MSAKRKTVSEGSPEGLSVDVEDGSDGIKKIMKHLYERAISRDGALAPEAEFQIELRSSSERAPLFEKLLHEVCPDGVDPGLWQRWISGGAKPFTDEALQKVSNSTEWPQQTVNRVMPRVIRQQKKIDKIKEQLANEEERLAFLKAHDNAAVHWVVVDHLISVMAPMFAMGPAWTIMRTVSSHVSDDEMEFQVGIFSGEEKIEVEAEVRQERMQLSEKIMASLDYFSGDYKFEIALRSAIEKVVDEYEPKRVEMIAAGRRARGRKRMFETINPEASEDAGEVIAALEETRKKK